MIMIRRNVIGIYEGGGGRIAAGGGFFAGGPFAAGLIAGGLFASGLNAAPRLIHVTRPIRQMPFGVTTLKMKIVAQKVHSRRSTWRHGGGMRPRHRETWWCNDIQTQGDMVVE